MFKRGIIIDVKYSPAEGLYCHGIRQDLTINEDGNEYEVTWICETSEDLFGAGDKVSFYLQDGTITRLRLNPFGV